MRALLQRVIKASVEVDGHLISEINKGLLIFLGVGKNDDEKEIQKLSVKISKLRIFKDDNGKMNLSIKDVGGQVLLISQFTLFADCTGGNRPSFFDAENPKKANTLYLKMRDYLLKENIDVKMGQFGADMKIFALNDGPVTIMLDSHEL